MWDQNQEVKPGLTKCSDSWDLMSPSSRVCVGGGGGGGGFSTQSRVFFFLIGKQSHQSYTCSSSDIHLD